MSGGSLEPHGRVWTCFAVLLRGVLFPNVGATGVSRQRALRGQVWQGLGSILQGGPVHPCSWVVLIKCSELACSKATYRRTELGRYINRHTKSSISVTVVGVTCSEWSHRSPSTMVASAKYCSREPPHIHRVLYSHHPAPWPLQPLLNSLERHRPSMPVVVWFKYVASPWQEEERAMGSVERHSGCCAFS